MTRHVTARHATPRHATLIAHHNTEQHQHEVSGKPINHTLPFPPFPCLALPCLPPARHGLDYLLPRRWLAIYQTSLDGCQTTATTTMVCQHSGSQPWPDPLPPPGWPGKLLEMGDTFYIHACKLTLTCTCFTTPLLLINVSCHLFVPSCPSQSKSKRHE